MISAKDTFKHSQENLEKNKNSQFTLIESLIENDSQRGEFFIEISNVLFDENKKKLKDLGYTVYSFGNPVLTKISWKNSSI